MAYGTVNVPGVSVAELEAVKSIAEQAQQDAADALEAAGAAQEDATAALDMLKDMLGGELPSSTLADNSTATIKAVASLGLGANFWSVGDTIGIALSGTVGALDLDDTYYAYIIGFNHNQSIEGTGIDFQLGKTADGVSIAFIDSNYGSSGSTDGFRMNTSNTNSGGWESSYMRQTICPAFLAAMPAEWQSIIAESTKYSDNTGGGTDDESYVTATQDKIWLLAEFEAFGTRTGANSAEQNYQKQYEYYANGNSRIKYRHSATGSTCTWWLRSVYATSASIFRDVYTGGSSNVYSASTSHGFAPGFKVV